MMLTFQWLISLHSLSMTESWKAASRLRRSKSSRAQRSRFCSTKAIRRAQWALSRLAYILFFWKIILRDRFISHILHQQAILVAESYTRNVHFDHFLLVRWISLYRCHLTDSKTSHDFLVDFQRNLTACSILLLRTSPISVRRKESISPPLHNAQPKTAFGTSGDNCATPPRDWSWLQHIL